MNNPSLELRNLQLMRPVLCHEHLLWVVRLADSQPLVVVHIILAQVLERTVTVGPVLAEMVRVVDTGLVEGIKEELEVGCGVEAAIKGVVLEPVNIEANLATVAVGRREPEW